MCTAEKGQLLLKYSFLKIRTVSKKDLFASLTQEVPEKKFFQSDQKNSETFDFNCLDPTTNTAVCKPRQRS